MVKLFSILILLATILAISQAEDASKKKCDLKASSELEKKQLERLTPLYGKNFQDTDENYNFYFAVCDIPDKVSNKSSNIGLIQEKLREDKLQYAIGRLDDVDLEGSDTWIRMVYRDGDKYGTVCSKSPRKAVIHFSCDYDATEPVFKKVEENNKREDDCSYLFEVRTSVICPKRSEASSTAAAPAITTTAATSTKKASGLGIFGIICLIVFSIALVYLIGGILYMRLVRHQRGWQQIPNFTLWNRIGNLQADICDYICRCNGAMEATAQPYESLTGQLSDDENMLNV